MELIFDFLGLISIIFCLIAILNDSLMYALLSILGMILSISGMFFVLSAVFEGVVHVIIYAGAVVVLFVFMIMMLNIGNKKVDKKSKNIKFLNWVVPFFLSFLLIVPMVLTFLFSENRKIILCNKIYNIKELGIQLFGKYFFLVELISALLLTSLIISLHVGKTYNNFKKYNGKI